MKFSKSEKKQLMIYVAIAFGVTYLMGILMWYGHVAGKSLDLFPNAQMLYPAAGVIVLLMATRKREEMPRRFFLSYLVVTVLFIAVTAASLFIEDKSGVLWMTVCQILIIGGSVLCGILLLIERNEKRIAYGLKGKNWKTSFVCIGVFILLYILRMLVAYILDGDLKGLEKLGTFLADPFTWIMFINIAINFFLSYLAFFGEEYSWRYYLQPMLQKRYGKRMGVIVLGIVWGLWHLPLDFFYYTSPDMGLAMTASQIVTCITLGIFFAYAYMKTENIWVPVILHFINNNLVALFSGGYSADVLENQVVTWGSVLAALVLDMATFGWFLLAKEFRKEN